jgi:hypothetical protein
MTRAPGSSASAMHRTSPTNCRATAGASSPLTGISGSSQPGSRRGIIGVRPECRNSPGRLFFRHHSISEMRRGGRADGTALFAAEIWRTTPRSLSRNLLRFCSLRSRSSGRAGVELNRTAILGRMSEKASAPLRRRCGEEPVNPAAASGPPQVHRGRSVCDLSAETCPSQVSQPSGAPAKRNPSQKCSRSAR